MIILVGPNDCGKTKYIEDLGGVRITETNGARKMALIKDLCAGTESVLIDDVDIHIDQEHFKELWDVLRAVDGNVIVSTHNALFLNYLEDQEAMDCMFLVKESKLHPYFHDEKPRDLDYMGPGEAFGDTDLDWWWGEQ